MSDLQTAKELRQKRAQIFQEAEKLRVESGDDMTPEQRENFDKFVADMESIGEQIEVAEKADEMRSLVAADEIKEARAAMAQPMIAGNQDTADADAESRDASSEKPAAEQRKEAREAFYRFGRAELSREQRDLVATFKGENLTKEQRAQAIGQDSLGGVLIPPEALQPIVDAKKMFGGMRRSRAVVFNTAHGADMPFPTANETGKEGRRIGENKKTATKDIDFGAVVLSTYSYTSDDILVPFALLRDSGIDLEAYILAKGAERIERVFNREATSYTGSSGPVSLLSKAAVGKTGATGKATTIGYEDLADLIGSVDEAYAMSGELMTNRLSIIEVMKLVDGDSRPLWLPGMATREPNTILGYPYIANSDMPQMAANKKSWAFGDLSSIKLRDVGGVRVKRLEEKYSDYDQIGFTMFSEHGACYVNAGTDPIKLYKNAAS